LTSDRKGAKEWQVTDFSNYQTVGPLHAVLIPATRLAFEGKIGVMELRV